jgi:nucleoside-diphosphate-sugar epimerase
VEESTPLKPTSFARQYGLAERPFLQAMRNQLLPVVMVRPGWVLGPGSWFRQFFLDPAARLGRVPCYGPGQNWMGLIHREDCAALIRRAATCGVSGQAYNLVAPPPWRQRQFVNHLGRLLDLPIQKVPPIRRGLDKALQEAFSASIRLRSQALDFYRGYEWRHADPVSALEAAVSKHKARTRP